MKKVGYARVSTQSQDLKSQVEQLKESGAEVIFSEKFTGTKTDRPQFNAMIEQLNTGDELIITKLDRLARNTKEALTIIDNLLEKDVSISVLNIGKLENTSVGRMIYTILLSVAEMERDMIISRTAEGKAYAKKHNANFKEGRPERKLTPQYIHAVKLLEGHTYKEVEKMTGISKSTLQRIKRQYKAEQKEQG